MKPILFNTKMVQAILDDRKLETRRPIKINFEKVYKVACLAGKWSEGYGKSLPEHLIEWYAKEKSKSPYQVGDILYVRETWGIYLKAINKSEQYRVKEFYKYKTDEGNSSNPSEFYNTKWRPSIHMPKTAARIFLEVTAVWVERLQDITVGDCTKEGIQFEACPHNNTISGNCIDCQNTGYYFGVDPFEEFISTFLKIYPDCTEESYVFAYEFKRIDKPEVTKCIQK